MTAHWDWVAILAIALLGAIATGVKMIADKVGRIAELLDIANQQRGEGNSSLRSIEHDVDVLRERSPQLRDEWVDDLIAKHPERP